MKNKLLYLICLIILYSCYPKEIRQTASFSLPLQGRVFYKVTDRNLGHYFKNPADSSLLGKIVPAIALNYKTVSLDSLKTLFEGLGICGYASFSTEYTPCDFRYFKAFKVNDKYKGIDTVFISNDWARQQGDSTVTNSFTTICSGKYHVLGTESIIYNYFPKMFELVGYYVDDFGYKEIVEYYPKMPCFIEDEFNSGLRLHKWGNAIYVIDSILTFNDTLIPKNDYQKYYEKYVIECQF